MTSDYVLRSRFAKALLENGRLLEPCGGEKAFKAHQKYQEAEKLLREGMKISPNAAPIYLVLSDVYMVTRRSFCAVKLLTNAIKRMPTDVHLKEKLASVYARRKQYAESTALYEEIVAARPRERKFLRALNDVRRLRNQELA